MNIRVVATSVPKSEQSVLARFPGEKTSGVRTDGGKIYVYEEKELPVHPTEMSLSEIERMRKSAGQYAGVCYMPHDFDAILNELIGKSMDRANMTLNSGHHSVYDHVRITLCLEDIPKFLAMILNNEKDYSTSEKSARFTKSKPTGVELEMYEKWCAKFEKLIYAKYGKVKYFDEKRIRKLAQENARYMISSFMTTTMVYTVSLRQLNYICNWLEELSRGDDKLSELVAPYAKQFVENIKKSGYRIEELQDGKGRSLSLIGKRVRNEQWGEMYSANYMGSLAMLAQAQRHRTIQYEMMLPEMESYFVPPILETEDLRNEWLEDMSKVSRNGIITQGRLVHINERGSYENLILKTRERLCTCAQLEINDSTNELINRYIKSTDDEFVRSELEKIQGKARCASGFKCTTPCGFAEGIDLSRIV
ncbi:MAG: FAD-dependent thymidylate synthase [Clostridiales bacterium]|nr:FAD-dependent thymidylate synthase [Clostridiales bacterium]